MVKSSPLPQGRIRHVGGGRKPALNKQSEQRLANDILDAASSHQPFSIPQLKAQAQTLGNKHFKANDGYISSFLTYQQNAWNTSALTNRWINDVWFKYVPDRSLLIWMNSPVTLNHTAIFSATTVITQSSQRHAHQ